MNDGLFLPYQKRWINDKCRFKIAEKARRTGMTFAQSYEDVEDCLKKIVPAVWFSSADLTAAKEYIDYCKRWADLFNVAAKYIGEEIVNNETTFVIEFHNSTKITALSSNPKAFRSKGGKVVLDEFAFHEQADELWKAARPSITSFAEYPLRVLSTHNGKNCKYFRFLDDIQKGKLNWSRHYIDIKRAVDEGLVDKIYGKKTTEEERIKWLESERAACGDELVWQQEYCCIPVDEATAFLTFDLIKACESDHILLNNEFPASAYYIGIDFGREKDLTVAWVLEKDNRNKITRYILELEKTAYSDQIELISELIIKTNARRVCVDASGLGDMPAETLQEKHGTYRVEKVKFSNIIKEELAVNTKMHFEDRLVLIPESELIRKDLHSVRKLTTSAGNTRYDAGRTKDGHADRFWALALALHATDGESGPILHSLASRGKRKSSTILNGYDGHFKSPF